MSVAGKPKRDQEFPRNCGAGARFLENLEARQVSDFALSERRPRVVNAPQT